MSVSGLGSRRTRPGWGLRKGLGHCGSRVRGQIEPAPLGSEAGVSLDLGRPWPPGPVAPFALPGVPRGDGRPMPDTGSCPGPGCGCHDVTPGSMSGARAPWSPSPPVSPPVGEVGVGSGDAEAFWRSGKGAGERVPQAGPETVRPSPKDSEGGPRGRGTGCPAPRAPPWAGGRCRHLDLRVPVGAVGSGPAAGQWDPAARGQARGSAG